MAKSDKPGGKNTDAVALTIPIASSQPAEIKDMKERLATH